MTNWAALGGNPCPGDPGGIRSAAHVLEAFGDKVAQQQRLLSAATNDTNTYWKGTAGNSFRTLAGTIQPVLTNTATSHHDAGSAMITFATQLQGFQTTALHLLAQAQQAVKDGAAAEASVKSWTSQLSTATTTYNDLASQPLHAGSLSANGPLTSASNTMTNCQTQLTAAQGKLNAAKQSFTSAHGHAVTLHNEAQAAATVCAHKVDKAGQWAKIKDELGKINDKAGWFLNAWGGYGGVVSSDKLFNLVQATSSYKSASAAEDAAFTKWNESDAGYFDWANSIKAQNAARSTMNKADEDFDDSFSPAASDADFLKIVGRAGLVAGMLSDVVTIIDPSPSWGPDGLLGGNTDRVMAGLNFAASGVALGSSLDVGLATTAMAIPGVDIVVGGVIICTAAYFAGEFVYQHWHAITHFVSSAYHTVTHAVTHFASSAWHDATSWL